tara:strand:+ start:561 stop:749 length:189 start_codon:yes stop_codon:yes gene_type:complete
MNAIDKIPEVIYKKIVDKIEKLASEKPTNIVDCFDSVAKRLPTEDELESILLYLNKKNLPQA